jgi:hypothetical protein
LWVCSKQWAQLWLNRTALAKQLVVSTTSYTSKKCIFNFVPENNKMKASFAEVKLSRLLECEIQPAEQGVFIYVFAKCVSWKKSHKKFFLGGGDVSH